jgi:hypothetical protein
MQGGEYRPQSRDDDVFNRRGQIPDDFRGGGGEASYRSGSSSSNYGADRDRFGGVGQASRGFDDRRRSEGYDYGYGSHLGRGSRDNDDDIGAYWQQPQTSQDHDYAQWRREQVKQLDDDYEAYRKERYGKFSDDFNNWRSQRAASGTRSSDSPADKTGTQGAPLKDPKQQG